MAKSAAQRFKEKMKGKRLHKFKKNNEETRKFFNEIEDLSFLTSPKQPDYKKFLAEPSWIRNK